MENNNLDVAEKVPEVSRALAQLSAGSTLTEALVEELREKLKTVLPNRPEKTGEDIGKGGFELSEFYAPLAVEIGTTISRSEKINRSLRKLIKDIEL